MTSQHAISLQDIVGERMPEHHGGNLRSSTHVQADKFQLRHRAWMHSLIDRRLYCAFPCSLAIRHRQASTPGPS